MNNLNDKSNRILVAIDGQYFQYYLLFGAVSEFQKKHPQEASIWIKDAELVDQKNLPDLTMCETFRRILKQFVMKRLETIDWQLKGHFQDSIDSADGIDFIYALDDYITNNFRKELYPEYKANRVIAKKSYNTFKIHQYIQNVIFKELEVEERYNYHIVRVEGAEGDDVIATLFKRVSKDYMLNVLFASDRDFVQLENVTQLNLYGKEVECKLADEKVTPSEYLLGKILLGDGSDNIKKVFEGVGDKRALKLIRNKELLKERLSENQDSAKQFLLNKKLISFDEIPKELSDKIFEELNVHLYKNNVLNDEIDFKNFMML